MGFFEVGELGFEDGIGRKVAATPVKTLRDQRRIPLQVDKADVPRTEFLAIRMLESRTCQDDVFPLLLPFLDRTAHAGQPGRTIAIGQRNALADFADVFDRMKIVGIGEFPTEPLGQ